MAAAAFAGLIMGSGAAAWAQTDGSSSSSSATDGSSSSSAPDSSPSAPDAPVPGPHHHHHDGSSDDCPNMGPDSGSSSNNVPSNYSGA